MKVQGQSLMGVSHNDAVDTLREINGSFTLLVCDGYDEREIAENNGSLKSSETKKKDKKIKLKSITSMDDIAIEEDDTFAKVCDFQCGFYILLIKFTFYCDRFLYTFFCITEKQKNSENWKK